MTCQVASRSYRNPYTAARALWAVSEHAQRELVVVLCRFGDCHIMAEATLPEDVYYKEKLKRHWIEGAGDYTVTFFSRNFEELHQLSRESR